jgi:hypothetical protein
LRVSNVQGDSLYKEMQYAKEVNISEGILAMTEIL